MSYHYRCPLCLSKLGKGHKLIVFQNADPTAQRTWNRKRIDCSQTDFIQEILKFGGHDAFNAGSEDAVFISHLQCKVLNPFWDNINKEIRIPGNPLSGGHELSAEFPCSKTGLMLQKTLSHWVIGMLRNTYKYGAKHSPMWYPFPLLRATASENDDDLSRPFGSLVEMASTEGVGKTILTLQLLNEELYRQSRILDVTDFFYPRGNFLEELYFRCMWRDGPVSRPMATRHTSGDMRALFVKPVAKPAPADSPNGTAPKSRWGSALDSAGKGLKYFFTETFKLKGPAESNVTMEEKLKIQGGEFWNPVLFYDTAGEQQRVQADQIKAVHQITNKVAICIDAREIFDLFDKNVRLGPGERNKSIKHASSRIASMELRPHRKRKACIVITRLDEIAFSGEERELVRRIAEDLDIDDDAARIQLVGWLNANKDSDKEKLIDYLERRGSVIDRVFFVWTENLPRMEGIRYSPIKDFAPPVGRDGTVVTLTANAGFNFSEVKKVYFRDQPGAFEVVSDSQIKATVPAGARSGFIWMVLEGHDSEGNPISDAQATSEKIFEIELEKGTDAAKPRSFGLVKFLAWCVNKRVDEIARNLFTASRT